MAVPEDDEESKELAGKLMKYGISLLDYSRTM
jgi:hypothetical protein